MATTADFRNGFTFTDNGELFSIIEFQHVKPGKGGAFVRTKLRNIKTKAVIDRTFRAGEKVEEVRRALKKMKISFAFAGRVTKGKGVHVLNNDGEDYHCTEIRCEEDELARIWTLYPRGGKYKDIESENNPS